VLHVGTRLIDLTTGSHSLFEDPEVGFVGINVRPRDAHKLGAVAVVADAKVALRELLAALGDWRAPAEWRDRAVRERRLWQEALAADLAPRAGELMSQAQVLRALNETAGPGDRLVVASGTPHVDVHKLWDPAGSARCHMEVGFSCMGGEIPAALGVRMALGGEGEVYVAIGDGTWLMGNTSELVTARQEGLKLTVLVVENEGYQSIHGLQRARTGRSFGLEFRERGEGGLTGPYAEVDYAANARSLGCAAFVVSSIDELRDALAEARRETRPAVIVARVEPRRLMLDSGCWWDVGVAELSDRPETRELAAEHARGRALQRHLG
jgi:3D-(3,5/4)-trihydroxycyclohexane-1,2-dione acylhydrolase (decyclizing)